VREWQDGELARAIALEPDTASSAEGELYSRFARRVRLYGLRHLRAEDAAHDLAHDTMLLTLRKLRAGEVREPDRIASFVLGVARMLVRERHRNRSRETPLDDGTGSGLMYEPVQPDQLAADLLKKCLEALAERERSILLLTYFAEQTAASIAQSLGIEAGNVRVIRHRGMTILRDCMGAQPEVGR
jgi:RNA polymerase sigma-70 factor (ECF subfamily)